MKQEILSGTCCEIPATSVSLDCSYLFKYKFFKLGILYDSIEYLLVSVAVRSTGKVGTYIIYIFHGKNPHTFAKNLSVCLDQRGRL